MRLYRDPRQIIRCVPVGGDFDLELRGLLLPIDNRTVRVGCLCLFSIDIYHSRQSKGVLRLRRAQFLVTLRQRMSSQMRYIDPHKTLPNSKHNSSNSSVVYLSHCQYCQTLTSHSNTYSRPSSLKSAALSTEIVGIMRGLIFF